MRSIVFLSLLFILLVIEWTFPQTIFAAADFKDFCEGVPGTVCGSVTSPHRDIFTGVGTVMLRVAGGLSVIFIVWAGYQMAMSMGDDGKLAQARMSIVYVLVGLFLAIISQTFVAGIAGQTALTTGLKSSRVDVEVLGQVAELLVTIFNIIFVLFIILAGIRMVLARGKPDEFNKARHMIAWIIGGALVLNLAYILVKIVTTIPGIF